MKTILLSRSSRASHANEVAFYKDLIKAYVSLSGNTNAPGEASLENRSDFHIDGVDFFLGYSPQINRLSLQISARILQIESGQEAAVYPKMLKSNLHRHGENAPVLALSLTAPTVLALMRLPLRQVTPPMLDQVLKSMAQAVPQWQTELLA